jgi:hypothetical protein
VGSPFAVRRRRAAHAVRAWQRPEVDCLRRREQRRLRLAPPPPWLTTPRNGPTGPGVGASGRADAVSAARPKAFKQGQPEAALLAHDVEPACTTSRMPAAATPFAAPPPQPPAAASAAAAAAPCDRPLPNPPIPPSRGCRRGREGCCSGYDSARGRAEGLGFGLFGVQPELASAEEAEGAARLPLLHQTHAHGQGLHRRRLKSFTRSSSSKRVRSSCAAATVIRVAFRSGGLGLSGYLGCFDRRRLGALLNELGGACRRKSTQGSF